LGVVRGLATFLFIIAIPLALISTNVRYLANEGRVYTYAFDEYDAPATTGIARSELVRASAELRDYFNNNAESFYTRVKQGERGVPLFNEREVRHLHDVKQLFGWVFHVQEIAFVYILAYVAGVFIWARERSLRALALHALIGGVLTIAIIVLLGAFAVSGFERTFERFHLIAFSNDLWRFDPRTDHLVQMFPEEFWFDVTMITGLMTIGEAALLSLVSVIHLTVTHGSPANALALSGQHP
jgi:integral membrane protein (TIGR01906 family)